VCQVCVIGAGKMSRLLFKHMAAKGCTRAVLLNRSLPRAQAMAEEFPQVWPAVTCFRLRMLYIHLLRMAVFAVHLVFAILPTPARTDANGC